MNKRDLLKNGLTINYSLLSIKILMILNKVKENERFSLNEREKEVINRAKILIDKMTAWSRFIEDISENTDEKKEVRIKEVGYVTEGMALYDIISGDYYERVFLDSKFFVDISRSLWLLMGEFSFDSLVLERLYEFFDKFQKKLSALNNAQKYPKSNVL